MRKRAFGLGLGFFWALALVSGCSSSGSATSLDRENACDTTARQVAERLDTFLESFNTLTPEDFMAEPELEGLDEFQADVAQTIALGTQRGGVDCRVNDLESALDDQLQSVAGKGLLASFLVDSIRSGGQRSIRDVVVNPGDDVASLLGLLDTGSSMTFVEGTFKVDNTLLIRTGVTLHGAGDQQTLIVSSAADAAMAVFGGASLTMSDISIAHAGSVPASVLLSFGSSLNLDGVRLSGAVSDQDGVGGNGLVLNATDFDEHGTGTEQSRVITISNGEISDNDMAGVAITADLAPTITNSIIARNGACGLCYLDNSGGRASGNLVEGNSIGIQVSDSSSVELIGNELVNNTVAGATVGGSSNPDIAENIVEGNHEVGIGVQGESRPQIRNNVFGAQPVALSISGSSVAEVRENNFSGADVGLQVGEQAQPIVEANVIVDSVVVALVHLDESAGTFTENLLAENSRAGVIVDGSAAPSLRLNTIEGGEVGIAYTESGGGNFEANRLSRQGIGIDVGDDAAPHVEGNEIRDSSSAGVLFRSRALGVLRGNTIVDPENVGIQLSGSSDPVIDSNLIDGGQAGASLIENSRGQLVGNTFMGQAVGIGVSDNADPHIEDNRIVDATGAALTLGGDSAGIVQNNTILEAGRIGIQIADSAHPALASNMIFAAPNDPDEAGTETPDLADEPDESGTVGLLYVGDGAGTAVDNQVFGFVIGIRVGDSAAPTLATNLLDGVGQGAVGVVYDADASGRAVANRAINYRIGFQLSGAADPEIDGNIVEAAEIAGFLLQGTAAGSLTNNHCPSGLPGIALTEDAAPAVGDNDCSVVRR